MNNDTARTAPSRRRTKRRPVAAFALAALAVGGVGAAITSAAWTDNAFFAAPATAATFDLQGSLDGKAWSDSANPDAVELVVPADKLANLLPGQTRTIDLWVRNQGSVNAALTSTVRFATGSTFTQNPATSVTGLTASLTPAGGTAAADQFQLTVTAPADWATTNQGRTGTVVITVAATATA
jgi:hypothetical protein